MIELNEHQIIDEITQRLTRMYPAVPPEEITR
jgi:hypothetical protein